MMWAEGFNPHFSRLVREMHPTGFDAPRNRGLLRVYLSARRRAILSKVRQHRAETFAAKDCGKSAYLAGGFRL